MCNKRIKLALGITIALFATTSVVADDFTLDWWTIDGGGEMWTSGGDFELSGTIGQPDAGLVMAGGDFELTGGFWLAVVPGDCDGDGNVDMDDFDAFAACITGPDVSLGPDCACCDLDADADVDVADFAAFQRAFTGG